MMQKEFNYLKDFFSFNKFNNNLISKYIHNFLNSKYESNTPIITVPKNTIYVKLPFYDQIYSELKNNLNKLLRNTFPQLKINLIFTNGYTIKSIINHKDKIPKNLMSGIIYKFNCNSCNAVYIGSTVRQLNVRIAEHLGISPRTQTFITKPSSSSIRDHCQMFCYPDIKLADCATNVNSI